MKKRRRFCMLCKNLLLFFVEKMGYLIEKDGKAQGISIFTLGRNFPFVSFVSFVVLQDNIFFTLNLH